MKPLIKIIINDDGEHWEKKISVFGICVYHRHDHAKQSERKTIGFNVMASVPGEVEDEECWPDECKTKKK